MARAIFLKDFSYTSRRHNVGWHVKASPEPQTFPQELIDAALARKTVAIPVPTRRGAKREKTGGVSPAVSALSDSSLGQAHNRPDVSGAANEEQDNG